MQLLRPCLHFCETQLNLFRPKLENSAVLFFFGEVTLSWFSMLLIKTVNQGRPEAALHQLGHRG